MRFLCAIIFNVVLLSFCFLNETLFAGFKEFEHTYSGCGSIGKKYILSLKKELKGITLNSTQDDIFDAIKISLPCAGCTSCISKINKAIHKFFDNLQTDELLSDLKPIQQLIKASVLESCQAHQRKKRSLYKKKNKYHDLNRQIRDDYQDYLMRELTDDEVLERRASNQMKSKRKKNNPIEVDDQAPKMEMPDVMECLLELNKMVHEILKDFNP